MHATSTRPVQPDAMKEEVVGSRPAWLNSSGAVKPRGVSRSGHVEETAGMRKGRWWAGVHTEEEDLREVL